MILRKFIYKLMRSFNDSEPTRYEAEWALSIYPEYTPRMRWVLARYIFGCSIDEIAKERQLTRERIRQLIRKGVRLAWKHIDNPQVK